MAVLGAMLLGDRSAIERVTEALSKEDFYRDAHGRIYEAMVALAEKDEPVDIVTLQAELARRALLEQVGGYLYLVQLADFVPTTANITYYAKIVAEKGVLRRLIETASEIAGMAYGEVEEIDSLVDQAERAIFNVARKRSTEGFTPLRPLLTNAFEQIDTLYHEKGITTGINTGFKDLNYITSGLQPGELIIIAARPSMGKCLTANTLIDDPDTGERLTIEEAVQRKMRRIVGVSECGRVRPTAISDWIDSGFKPVFRVTTRTGRFVEVTGHHPFLTLQGWQPLHDLVVGNQIAVPRHHPSPRRSTGRLSLRDLQRLAKALHEGKRTWVKRLWTLGGSDVFASFTEIALGAGPFCTPEEEIARAVQHALLRGGVVASLSQTESGWTLTPFIPEPCRWPDLFLDEIVSIEPLGEKQVYDLTVPEGANFIAQDIVVHNTALTMNIGQNAALTDNKVVATFSLEMSKESLVQRLICSEARVDAHKLRTGFLQEEDWSHLANAVQRLWDAPLFIDDSTDVSVLEMRARCRRLRAEQGQLDLVIVDYLQLMRGSSRNSENRNQEISEIARGLKSLAREMEVPVIALSQLSRNVERREDKRPMLSDLRECVTGDTRLFDADSGLLVPIREIMPGQRILTVNGKHKVVISTVSQVWEKGIKPVFRVRTETGRVLRCTDNHPFLTPDGYRPLVELSRGARVGAALCRVPSEGGEICWEKIRSIVPDGEEATYDISVPETGCFLAEGIVVHNSGAIEAEADVVAFIYRPSYYARKEAVSQDGEEKADQERGAGAYEGEEAEIIIAKQRNGPVGTVKLSFLPKYARFADLEQNLEENPF